MSGFYHTMRAMKKLTAILFLVLAAALLNIGAIFLFQRVLGLPLFMGAMFTIGFTFFGGLPCGIATALMTHLINAFLQSTGLPDCLYVLCGIAAALITALFMRLFPAECPIGTRRDGDSAGPGRFTRRSAWDAGRIFDRIAVLFVLSLVMCAGMSLIGGIIGTVIETFFTPPKTLDAGLPIFRRILVRKELPLLVVEVLCRIPGNILDRLISVSGGCGFALALKKIDAGDFRAKLR
jgi:hypothetical protein